MMDIANSIWADHTSGHEDCLQSLPLQTMPQWVCMCGRFKTIQIYTSFLFWWILPNCSALAVYEFAFFRNIVPADCIIKCLECFLVLYEKQYPSGGGRAPFTWIVPFIPEHCYLWNTIVYLLWVNVHAAKPTSLFLLILFLVDLWGPWDQPQVVFPHFFLCFFIAYVVLWTFSF